MFNRLQYITQGDTVKEQQYNIHQALDNGCQWIQLRFKNGNKEELYTIAESTKTLCDIYIANFIINDDVNLALDVDADGVHLGLSDMNIKNARHILGSEKIIGATANTYEDVVNQISNGCDYIGLGPYQFTSTKDKLSPILGLEGYQSIISKLTKDQLEIPIYAIGGIKLEDVTKIIKTGVYGIAVSGLITQTETPEELITQLNYNLYGNIIV